MYLHRMLKYWSQRWPDRLAVRCGGFDVTWGELERRSEQIAVGLIKSGIRKGDRIGILMRNRIEFVESMFGIIKAGAAITLINIRMTSPELAYLISDADLSAIISEPDFLEILQGASESSPLPPLFVTEPAGRHSTLGDLKNVPEAPIDVMAEDDDVVLISYTSGTTG